MWVIGGLYVGVALLVVSTGIYWRAKRGKTGQSEPSVAAASTITPVVEAMPVSSDGVRLVQTATPVIRSVKRQNSAWLTGSTGGGADLATIERSIKMGFIRKVYSILATQLLLTSGICVGAIYLSFVVQEGDAGPDPSRLTEFGIGIISRGWLIWVLFVPLLFLLCCLHSMKNVYPCNYILLFLFTLIESYTLAYICVVYYSAGFGDQIVLSLAITTAIFLALTLFTMQSKVDWGFLFPMLYTSLWVLIFWSWFSFWLVPVADTTVRSVISLFGALIFCGFIVFDTNMIMKHMCAPFSPRSPAATASSPLVPSKPLSCPCTHPPSQSRVHCGLAPIRVVAPSRTCRPAVIPCSRHALLITCCALHVAGASTTTSSRQSSSISTSSTYSFTCSSSSPLSQTTEV